MNDRTNEFGKKIGNSGEDGVWPTRSWFLLFSNIIGWKDAVAENANNNGPSAVLLEQRTSRVSAARPGLTRIKQDAVIFHIILQRIENTEDDAASFAKLRSALVGLGIQNAEAGDLRKLVVFVGDVDLRQTDGVDDKHVPFFVEDVDDVHLGFDESDVEALRLVLVVVVVYGVVGHLVPDAVLL